ncbi:hypothetical protein MP228_001530 [Amoeboaphelidium protococcarum]|nr:hypothetical protein MP228_001530 [Amoeboaphelidium protococcarum]
MNVVLLLCLSVELLVVVHVFGHRHRISKCGPDEKIKRLLQSIDYEDFMDLAQPLLKTRHLYTPEHDQARDYLTAQLGHVLGSHNVQLHTFNYEQTILNKPLTVQNIVASFNFNASRQLTLAAHYDTLMKDGFIGMSDSAVPCAMILYIARILSPYLKLDSDGNNRSLQIMLFDAEEALVQWTHQDSIYGSRALVDQWSKLKPLAEPNSIFKLKSRLDQVDLLVLLDLLGVDEHPLIHDYYEETSGIYDHLIQIEDTLLQLGLLSEYRLLNKNKRYFVPKSQDSQFISRIEDDQLPFHAHKVPILHLIPSPFPSVWHTIQDNVTVMSPDIIQDFIKILSVFVCDYLDLWTFIQT